MSQLNPITITNSTPNISQYLAGIIHLHAHCITHDGTLATFLPPLSNTKMQKYWQDNLDQCPTSKHTIVITLPISSRSAHVTDPIFAADSPSPVAAPVIPIDGIDHEVAGIVVLFKPDAETGPFRGEVQKFFASPNHRQKGVGKAVMRELERLAREDGRWSLLLDTTVGTPAEHIYPKLGWKRLGVVDAYGINPLDGRLVDEVWYWKDLRKSAEL